MTPPDSAAFPRKLLLFDIDGTLIVSGGAGEQALVNALHDTFGVADDLKGVEIAGMTDSGIILRVFERHGIEPTPENVTAYLDRYLHHLALQLPQRAGMLLPGILPLLKALRPRAEVVMALLTGNVERGAELKLAHYGVWEFFEFGAFADDHHERNRLGPFAQARARDRHGVEFSGRQIYVIGDTPRDIECGRTIGAVTVAIATGMFSKEELLAHKPDHFFRDFSDTDAVLKVLLTE